MRLTDSVELLRLQGDGSLVSRGNTPAQVSYLDSGTKEDVETSTSPSGTVTTIVNRTTFRTEIRVIIGDVPLDQELDRLRIDGSIYRQTGAPLIRKRNGRTHHKTLVVELVN